MNQLRIEHNNDVRNNLPTPESREAFSNGHRAAMDGKAVPTDVLKSETAEARSFKNGFESGLRSRKLKGGV